MIGPELFPPATVEASKELARARGVLKRMMGVPNEQETDEVAAASSCPADEG